MFNTISRNPCARINSSWIAQILALTSLLAAMLTGPAALATDYSDGGTHTVSTPDSGIVVSNGSTVNVVPGATLTGINSDPFGQNAITVLDSASVLNVTSGTMTGGDGSHSGGSGLTAFDGHFTISGGTFIGGSSSGVDINHPGGNGASLSFQSLSVSGGSFTGGFGFDSEGGDGLRIDSVSPNTALISGGTFTNGGGFNLHVTGPTTANISGGNFLGFHSGFMDNSIGNLSGGTFSSQTEGHNQAVLNVTNGQFNSFSMHDDTVLNVSGGTFSSSFSLFDNAVMNLTGGQILPSLPERFILGQNSVLNIYGTGLSLTHLFGTFWDLQGTLQDGTPLPTPAAVLLNDNAVVHLHTVPEPAGIMLAIFALAGFAVLKRG
jgi:hypothetical protein